MINFIRLFSNIFGIRVLNALPNLLILILLYPKLSDQELYLFAGIGLVNMFIGSIDFGIPTYISSLDFSENIHSKIKDLVLVYRSLISLFLIVLVPVLYYYYYSNNASKSSDYVMLLVCVSFLTIHLILKIVLNGIQQLVIELNFTREAFSIVLFLNLSRIALVFLVLSIPINYFISYSVVIGSATIVEFIIFKNKLTNKFGLDFKSEISFMTMRATSYFFNYIRRTWVLTLISFSGFIISNFDKFVFLEKLGNNIFTKYTTLYSYIAPTLIFGYTFSNIFISRNQRKIDSNNVLKHIILTGSVLLIFYVIVYFAFSYLARILFPDFINKLNEDNILEVIVLSVFLQSFIAVVYSILFYMGKYLAAFVLNSLYIVILLVVFHFSVSLDPSSIVLVVCAAYVIQLFLAVLIINRNASLLHRFNPF